MKLRRSEQGGELMNKIEVSVVILVLVIVGTLIFPARQKQKAKSCSPNCTSNLKQLGLASALYEADNRGGISWSATIGNLYPGYFLGPTVGDSDGTQAWQCWNL
jgi:hypothetical protein